jgi:isopentenyl phosphate kinase
MDEALVFIKLGGSLITYKDQPETACPNIIEASLQAIQELRIRHPNLRILLGHGSGSFGHTLAKHYGTMNGVSTPADWLGFAEVAKAAKALNDLVFEIGIKAGLPLTVFRPSALVLTNNREIISWDISPIQSALQQSAIPLVYGDVVVDTVLGGTILSTEDLFLHLSESLKPSKMLIAGIEAGVYADFPKNSLVIPEISRNDPLRGFSLDGAHTPDVTGGMLAKVKLLQAACAKNPGMSAFIYSGVEAENTIKIVSGQHVGTQIR